MTQRDTRDVRSEINRLREAVEDRTDAVDKTLEGVSTLSRSLEQLVARQQRRERTLTLNSFVAYLLFTLLLGGGFTLLYHSRAGDLVDERDQAMAERDAARERARTLQDEQAARAQAANEALEYYQLLRDGKHAEAIAGYGEVAELELSPTERGVFEDGVAVARAAMVDAGYLEGVDAFRRGDYEAATAELRRALAYADESPRAAQMRHYLGVSLGKQGSPAEAVRQLELAIAGRVDDAGIDDSRYHLAAALQALGREEEAREAYQKFATAHPAHRLAPAARRAAAQILRDARQRARDAAAAARQKVAAERAAERAAAAAARQKAAAERAAERAAAAGGQTKAAEAKPSDAEASP